jgi:hypothetical protein
VGRAMLTVPPMDELENAWAEVHAATPPGWQVGRPAFDERRGEWSLYAWDATERVEVNRSSREWTAVHPTQTGVLRAMARCVREIGAGRIPK